MSTPFLTSALRPFSLPALALLLGGCWQADWLLVPEGVLAAPPVSGRFGAEGESYRGKVDGAYLAVERQHGRSWEFDRRLSFVKLDGPWFLVESYDSAAAVTYAVARQDGRGLEVIVPQCDLAMMDGLLVDLDRQTGACEFIDYNDVKSAAATLIGKIAAGDMSRVSRSYRLSSE